MIQQFGDVLRSIGLPNSWREAIAERCLAEAKEDDDTERVRHRRAELEAEQKRLVMVFTKGLITEQHLDAEMERIRAELFTLPLPVTKTADEMTRAALSAGETLENMADYWSEATAEERRDMVWFLLNIGGLIYDLERRVIVGILPRESVLPVLSLGLETTAQWEQRGGGLWLRQEYWPEKRERSTPHVLPPQESSLTPAQQEEALEMLRSGASLRQVAQRFGINHESVRRMARRKQGEQEE